MKKVLLKVGASVLALTLISACGTTNDEEPIDDNPTIDQEERDDELNEDQNDQNNRMNENETNNFDEQE